MLNDDQCWGCVSRSSAALEFERDDIINCIVLACVVYPACFDRSFAASHMQLFQSPGDVLTTPM